VVLAALKARATRRTLDGMARYGIPATHAWGVAVGDIRALGKQIGRDHALAAELWESGLYEARMLTAFVDDPERVTPAQMDRWCRDFDSWAICDALCFHLFDRTPHAFDKVAQWANREEEFVKRAAFALLASLGVHDRSSGDAVFAACLPLVERAAHDDRNFVKKGVSWALRVIGRRNARLHRQALALSRRLAQVPQGGARWVGRDALRELTSPAVLRRF
jgi:3-methyladenine DNA glycosylase AlkD